VTEARRAGGAWEAVEAKATECEAVARLVQLRVRPPPTEASTLLDEAREEIAQLQKTIAELVVNKVSRGTELIQVRQDLHYAMELLAQVAQGVGVTSSGEGEE
jgi:hypothetical protein